MKLYVVKRIDNKYLSKYSNYDYRLENPCEPCWTEKLYNAKIFEKYDEADNFCNTIDCQIVECSFMENFELSYLMKKVRKEVCEEIRKQLVYYPVSLLDEAGKVKDNVWGISMKDLTEILDQIQDKKNDI